MKIIYQPSLALPTMKAEKNEQDIKKILEMAKIEVTAKIQQLNILWLTPHEIIPIQCFSKLSAYKDLKLLAYLKKCIEQFSTLWKSKKH